MSAVSCVSASGLVAARRLRLAGRVQGVGFRPFVYRLALECGLSGEVRNRTGQVEIIAQGPPDALDRFEHDLIAAAPPLAQPHIESSQSCAPTALTGFRIATSSGTDEPRVFVPPDYFMCDECRAELEDPHDRRYRYPFINCTQCGPRYTLIVSLPYDRPATTMAGFALCPRCRKEYEDPADRRFHAEPVACPECGPTVTLSEPERGESAGEAALERAVHLLKSGAILAVKGVGGYHLLCDARSHEAVARLRARKHRPDKPLAVMLPVRGADGLAAVREYTQASDVELAQVRHPARPIVLIRRSQSGGIAAGVAPGLAEIGVFLPYAPLHHLLLDGFAGPLVATSGNVSGEPVLTSTEEATQRLAGVADAFLHHDRPIARPADDSVCRVIAGRPRFLRVGRGHAPLELEQARAIERPLLAVGGHLKTTVALAWGHRVVVSPHIADMGTPRSARVFAQLVADLPRLYGVRPEVVVCDRHPDYATTRWARSCGLDVQQVQHHHAHASALAGEHHLDDPMLVFAWDGVGYGADGTLWGGEAFRGSPGRWQRVARLAPFRLPGGERAAREPWRSAASLCWHAGLHWSGATGDAGTLLHTAWQREINSPWTSAVGRLFDAAAAFVLDVRRTSFEGQGPMLLEAAATHCDGAYPRCALRSAAGLYEIDWLPILPCLLDRSLPVGARAAALHEALADAILAVAQRERAEHGITSVGLTGGVFQNRRLTELAHERLSARNFAVVLAERVPCNDGGLAFGQVIEASACPGTTTGDSRT